MITSLQNPVVKHCVKLRENARYRKESGSIFVTGSKLILDLLKSQKPKRIFYAGKKIFNDLDSEIFSVSEQVLKKMTGQPAPDKLAAEFPYPKASTLKNVTKLLVLDHISDPGNLGTLIRTAVALGWDGIFFLPHSVDPFHERATRASQGALYDIAWKQGNWEDLEKIKKSNRLTAFIADLEGTSLHHVKQKTGLLLLLSHEASGVSEKGEAFGQKITIPLSGKVESLNVSAAGAILMYGLIN